MAPNEFYQTQPLLPERRGPGSFILRRLLINGFARLSSPFLYWLKAAGTARLTGARTPTVPRLCRAAAESCLPRVPGRAGLGVAHITPLPPAVVAAAMRIPYSLRVIFVSVSSPPTCPQTSRRATESTSHSLPSPTPIGGGARSFSSRDVSGCGCDHTNRRGPPLKIGFQGRIRVSPGPVNLFSRPGNTLAPAKIYFLAAVYRSGCAVRP